MLPRNDFNQIGPLIAILYFQNVFCPLLRSQRHIETNHKTMMTIAVT